MSGFRHEWNGTVLTIISDSGTSSADLKGSQGDIGPRGPQGPAGVVANPDDAVLEDYATKDYVDTRIIGIELLPGPAGPAYELTEADKNNIAFLVKQALFVFNPTTGRLDITV
jgi:hypothetical protein